MKFKKFTKRDFSKIISNYSLGEYKSFKNFAHGWCQVTVLLITTRGKFVLKYYKNRSKRHVLFEINLLNYLKRNKHPVPAIIKNSCGKYLGRYNGRNYIMTEHVDGKSTKNPNKSSNYKQLSEAVKIVAQLHNTTRGYRPKYYKDHKEYSIKYCWEEYKKRSRKVKNKNKENWLKNELKKLKFPGSLSRRICHCDLNYSNFLFKKGKVVAVLDFDMSCYTYLVYDVASLIYWWAWPPKKKLKTKKAKHVLKEYSKYGKLNKFEKNYIYDALKLIILLGISWSEEDDFKQEKRKIEYLNSIGRKEYYNKLFN